MPSRRTIGGTRSPGSPDREVQDYEPAPQVATSRGVHSGFRHRHSVARSGSQPGGAGRAQADAGTPDAGSGTVGRSLPRIAAPEIAGQELRRDSEAHGRPVDQYRLHLGLSLPPAVARSHGRRLGGGQEMSREEIQKLLGGYATDTLSAAERSALFEAALEDQELFDALAKEQALRDVLQDVPAREQLIAALGPARDPFARRAWRWLGWLHRPAALAMAGGMLAVLIGGGLALWRSRPFAHREVLV